MTTALILPRDRQPSGSPELLVLWDAHLPPEGYGGRWVSLPDEVRRNRIVLRARFTAWIAEMGCTPVRGRTLAERLLIRPGLSYWWMSVPSEYSFEESSFAYAVVRLMALTDVAEREGTTAITSALNGRGLNDTLAEWCRTTGRSFDSAQPIPGSAPTVPRTRAPRLGAARRWARAWRDARPDTEPARRGRSPDVSDSVLIVDYLAHVDRGPLGPRSRYWASLPELLRRRGAEIEWLHLFVPTPTTPTTADAVALAQQMSSGQERHQVAQAALSTRARLGALVTFTRICRLRLSFVRHHPRLLLGTLDPWPLLRESTCRDFLGQQAMDNALWIQFFDHYLKDTPPARLGIYLQENQPWEMALTAAWRRNGHGTLVGVQHTTVRFWDLRYLKESTPESGSSGGMPTPDLTVMNGEAARRALSGFASLGERTVVAEALRFIDDPRDHPTAADDARLAGPPRLLAIVEYDEGYAADQARLVREVVTMAERDGYRLDVTWRPHPASTGTAPPLPSAVHHDRDTPMTDLLMATDVALVGDFSSALLQARALGVCLARLPSSRTFGNDTDDGNPDVALVSTPEAVIARLRTASRLRSQVAGTSGTLADTFELDPAMPLWQAVLDSVGLVGQG